VVLSLRYPTPTSSKWFFPSGILRLHLPSGSSPQVSYAYIFQVVLSLRYPHKNTLCTSCLPPTCHKITVCHRWTIHQIKIHNTYLNYPAMCEYLTMHRENERSSLIGCSSTGLLEHPISNKEHLFWFYTVHVCILLSFVQRVRLESNWYDKHWINVHVYSMYLKYGSRIGLMVTLWVETCRHIYDWQ